VLGPRLNAAGRLADANACVDLLTTDDIGRARILAADLEALNARRKLLCNQVEQGAEAQIARDPSLLEGGALVLANPAWPAGIIGIVASRLVEKYGKPTILIASPPGEVARASARSVVGVNITAALAAHVELLVNFGIDPERIPDLRRALSRTTAAMLADAHVETGLRIDGFLPLAELTPALADDLSRLAPFGPGNPPLTLAAERLLARPGKKVGRNNEHRLVIVTDEAGVERQVIWWDGGSEPLPEGRFDLAYVARNSTYRGTRELQVEWMDARPYAEAEVEVKAKVKDEVEVEDYRRVEQPSESLTELVDRGEVAVWREGEGAGDIPGHDRWSLPRAATLVIWTAPPGPAELRAALTQVGSTRVCLFGRDPGTDTPDAFLRRLTGLVKHTLSARAGRAPVAQLAAATAQCEATVRLGLAWLAARGHVRIMEETSGEVQLVAGDGPSAPDADFKALDTRLRAALAETAAYRAYFREADAAALLRR
jgi:single-stranded-DNA-specific exonuclease